MSEFLVCKKCGYKESYEPTVKAFKNRFKGKGLSTHMTTDGRTINSYKKKFSNIKDISKVPYRCKCCESIYGKLK